MTGVPNLPLQAVTSGTRKGLFHGWWVVAASCVGLSTNPGQFAYGALALFMQPMQEEFGWSRTGISLALTTFTCALAVTLPFVGRLVDRAGGRAVLLPSMAVFGLLLALIPVLVSELWHLWIIFVLVGSLAAGANALPYMRIIGAWFDRRRGLAFGVAMAGGGIGYAYVPPLLQWLIDNHGWRSGYHVLGGIVVFIALPLVVRFVRESPEEIGLHADGAAAASVVAHSNDTGAPISFSSMSRNRTFQLLFAVFVVLSLCLYGGLAHLKSMLVDRGMSDQAAALAQSTLGMAIIVSRAAIGYLIDRLFAPLVAMGCFIMSAMGFLLLAAGGAGSSTYLGAALIGLSIGAEIDLLGYLTSRYFGLADFGAVYGLLFSAFLVGTATGPVVYGVVYDWTGSYLPVLVGATVSLLAVAASMRWLPAYDRPGNPDIPESQEAN